MRPTTALAATMALSGLVAALSPAIAAPSGYMFTTIDVPGSIPGSTDAAIGEGGINDLGEIVGNFADSTGVHGFLYNGGKFTTINPPGSTFTVLSGINNRGQILGSSSSVPSPEGNFLYEHGVFTPLNVPAFLFGLNDRGQIVGQICDNTGCHGLLDTRGSIATLDVPGSTNTGATAINNPGQIVGTYQDTTGLFHSFLDTRGVFTNFDVPGSGFTLAFGINDPGQIVGAYCDATFTICPGFLDTKGIFTTVNVPGSTFTNPLGINDRGDITGVFADSTGLFHGFLATPIHGNGMSASDPPAAPVPEPSSLALVAVGLIGVGLIIRPYPFKR